MDRAQYTYAQMDQMAEQEKMIPDLDDDIEVKKDFTKHYNKTTVQDGMESSMTIYEVFEDEDEQEYDNVIFFLHGYEDDAWTYLEMYQNGKFPLPKKSKVCFFQSPLTIYDEDLEREVTPWHADIQTTEEPAKTQLGKFMTLYQKAWQTEMQKLEMDNTSIFLAGVCQGAKVGFQAYLRSRKPMGGLFMFAGYLPRPILRSVDKAPYEDMEKQFNLASKSETSMIYQQGGAKDEMYPPEKVRDNTTYLLTKLKLEKNFVKCNIVENCGHEVHIEGLKDMKEFVDKYQDVKKQYKDIIDLGDGAIYKTDDKEEEKKE